jgi:hypothetical protein
MLEPDFFKLTLEKELRMKVIEKEVQECNDIEVLKTNLLTCAESLMRFQHLTTKLVEQQLQKDMNDFFSTIGIETAEM